MTGRSTALPDHKAREAIVGDLDTSMIVEAAAGTGKTTAMIARMVALLETGRCRIDSMAAVTFTRKAAAELRSRFHLELERRSSLVKGEAGKRLDRAASNVERCFIGTIHSFCARLLRERPVEAGVDPDFAELEDDENEALLNRAWGDLETRMFMEGDAAIDDLDILGLNIRQLKGAFLDLAGNADVMDWPSGKTDPPDFSSALSRLRAYADHMRSLCIPAPPRNSRDRLMYEYRRIPKRLETLGEEISRPARLLEVLEGIRPFKKNQIVQKQWPGESSAMKRELALTELDRWNDFAARTAQPAVTEWREYRYGFVIPIVQKAVVRFNELKKLSGGLNFQDLLTGAAALLRENPEIREFFRQRFTHLLVDEFQDTDPVQAEVMMMLTSGSTDERDWRRCAPDPGSLFVVGDPKQSIYRFRRADISVYNEVRDLIVSTGGVCVNLYTNFRSSSRNIQWFNQVFSEVFPEKATRVSPGYVPLQAAHPGEVKAAPEGVMALRLPETCKTGEECVRHDSELIARTIRSAIDTGQSVYAPDGSFSDARPSDFLIITRNTTHLSDYAEALQALDVPHSVTGGSAMNETAELYLLHTCLLAASQPHSPVAVAAALRSPLFGTSDDTLYRFRRAGGEFSAPFSIPDGLSGEERKNLAQSFSLLWKYAGWLDEFPPVAAVEKVAADLGLFASAASQPGGDTASGSIGKAIELLRSKRPELVTSMSVIDYLGRIVTSREKHDSVSSLPPARDVVRVMNLHKVKGLQAPVVFLADPTGRRRFPVEHHIDRSTGAAKGYMAVNELKEGFADPLRLAQAPGWDDTLAPLEHSFTDAEELRLMYVAATRAGTRLIITQRPSGSDRNYWSFFTGHLEDAPSLADPGPVSSAPDRAAEDLSPDEAARANAAIARKWESALEPSYKKVTATGLLKEWEGGNGPISGGMGPGWGNVVHSLLQAAAVDTGFDLASLAETALRDNGLDGSLAPEAVMLVRQVMDSSIWKRAAASDKWLVEVPFALREGLEQAEPHGMFSLCTGTIDLAFREHDGWVIVDYKTGGKKAEDAEKLIQHYRPQIELYSESWESITGFRVKEKGFYFVDLGVYLPLA